jgi:hypothetical protein
VLRYPDICLPHDADAWYSYEGAAGHPGVHSFTITLTFGHLAASVGTAEVVLQGTKYAVTTIEHAARVVGVDEGGENTRANGELRLQLDLRQKGAGSDIRLHGRGVRLDGITSISCGAAILKRAESPPAARTSPPPPSPSPPPSLSTPEVDSFDTLLDADSDAPPSSPAALGLHNSKKKSKSSNSGQTVGAALAGLGGLAMVVVAARLRRKHRFEAAAKSEEEADDDEGEEEDEDEEGGDDDEGDEEKGNAGAGDDEGEEDEGEEDEGEEDEGEEDEEEQEKDSKALSPQKKGSKRRLALGGAKKRGRCTSAKC